MAETSGYEGTYYSGELDVSYRLYRDGDELWLSLRNTAPRRLLPDGDGWRAGGWRLAFERGTDGVVTGFTVNAGRVTDIRFERR